MLNSEIAFMQQFSITLLSLTPGLPLLFAFFCALPQCHKNFQRILPVTILPALLTVFFVPPGTNVSVTWFFMGGCMGIDQTGSLFLGASGVVWLLSATDLSLRLSDDRDGQIFFVCFLAAMAGNFGLILAKDILGFYLFFAMMSFSSYGLIVFDRNRRSLAAGRLYIIMVMISEVSLFTALTLLFNSTGSLAIAALTSLAAPTMAVVLLYIGLGIKIGVLPFHLWMPAAYQQTPIPAAAALAGSMLNAGILGWLILLFPLHQQNSAWGIFLVTAGATAAFYGVFIGLTKQKGGEILACSSISQMGLFVFIVGIGFCIPAQKSVLTTILTLFAVHHSLHKSCLFWGYGRAESKGPVLKKIHAFALMIPGLALAGLPLTSGHIIKTALKNQLMQLDAPWQGAAVLFLTLSSAATTLLILHFIRITYRMKPINQSRSSSNAAWYGSLFLSFTAFWLWPQIRTSAWHSLALSKLLQSLWPIALGLLLMFAWRKMQYRNTLISFMATLSNNISQLAFSFSSRFMETKQVLRPLQETDLMLLHFGWKTWRHGKIQHRLRKTEKILGRWISVGIVYLGLFILLFLML